MHNDEVKFPTPICSDTEPHAKHRILGTWRTERPGAEGVDSAAKSDREGPWFVLGDRVTTRGWESSEYHRAGLNVFATVVETKPIAGSKPARQQFRAEGADWCGDGSMWNHSDDYVLAPDCQRRVSPVETEQWIAEQVAQLSENELVLVKTVLDEIRAGRPVEHFMPGTKVYADSWGTAEFIVQGTAPWYDENGVAHRKVEIKSASGGLSGHVHPSELRRVPPYSPASACTCPLGPEDAHFPDCPRYVAR